MRKKHNYLIIISCILFLLLLPACKHRNNQPTTTEDPEAPIIFESETFEVKTSTQEYAQGLAHESWGGDGSGIVSLELDVYEPIDAPDNRPVIMIIHGGAFAEGDKADEQYEAIANYFASRGWVAFSINYRLQHDKGSAPEEWIDFSLSDSVPEARKEQFLAMYAAIRDSKSAVRWVHANAEEYGINTEYITSLGASAGAFTSVALGVTDEEDFKLELSEEDSTLVTTNLEESSKIHTIISLWGGTWAVGAIESIYGENRFDESDAPILIAHGDQDNIVDFAEAEVLKNKYIETGVFYEFYKLEGATHNAWLYKIDEKNLTDLAFDFIVETQNLKIDTESN